MRIQRSRAAGRGKSQRRGNRRNNGVFAPKKRRNSPLEYILNYKKLTETAKVPTRLKEVESFVLVDDDD